MHGTRRSFLKSFSLGAAAFSLGGCREALSLSEKEAASGRKAKPNFVIIFTDDQGYGDLGSYGHPLIKTPHLDRMARQGTRFTSFYAQTVCGPSRGALLTGCYPQRLNSGGWYTDSSEVTIGEMLKEAGYATGCIGKWDVSSRMYIDGSVPNDQGFDEYFGALGANDGGAVQLWRNKEQLEKVTDMGSLTKRYTDEAIEFIKKKKDSPFLLYLAHTMAHVVIDASEQFRGKSKGDLYGDVIEEIDFNCGRVFDTLKKLGLNKNTYVLFISDNGPWSGKEDIYIKSHGGHLATGSAGPLRNGKGSAWEGGFRVPCILKGPNIPASRESNAMWATLDLMPTIAALAGGKVPDDRVIDGVDQTDLITGKSDKSARDTFFYYVKNNLHAVRKGKWKLALPDRKILYYFAPDDPPVNSPELYDLESDISEKHNVAKMHPKIVKELLKLADEVREDIGDMDKIGKNSRYDAQKLEDIALIKKKNRQKQKK